MVKGKLPLRALDSLVFLGYTRVLSMTAVDFLPFLFDGSIIENH